MPMTLMFGSHAKSAGRGDIQIAPKLLNRVTDVDLNALDGGRSFAGDEKRDSHAVRFAKQIFPRLRDRVVSKFLRRDECFWTDVERRTGDQERPPPMGNLRFPK